MPGSPRALVRRFLDGAGAGRGLNLVCRIHFPTEGLGGDSREADKRSGRGFRGMKILRILLGMTSHKFRL